MSSSKDTKKTSNDGSKDRSLSGVVYKCKVTTHVEDIAGTYLRITHCRIIPYCSIVIYFQCFVMFIKLNYRKREKYSGKHQSHTYEPTFEVHEEPVNSHVNTSFEHVHMEKLSEYHTSYGIKSCSVPLPSK